MLKRVCAIILFCLFVLAACGTASDEDYNAEGNYDNAENYYCDYDEYLPPGINFAEPSARDRIRHAAEMTAQAGRRTYMFLAPDEEYNMALAVQFEDIAYIFSNFLVLDMHLPVVFTQDQRHYRISATPGEELIFNPNDPATYGWFIYAMAMGRIPMWLSVGMEMSVRGIGFDYPLAGLCDTYFAPFSWGTAGHRQAVSTAYHFVNYLIENDYLSDMVLEYLTGDREVADLLASFRFSLFSGYYLDTFFSLEFHGTGYNITASTYFADYSFEFPSFIYEIFWRAGWDSQREVLDIDDMDRARLLRSVSFVDDTINFVKNWFKEYTDLVFEPIATHIPMMFGTGAGADVGWMNFPINMIAVAAAHEVSHVLSFAVGGGDFKPFEEGLAMKIGALHRLYDKDGYAWRYQMWTGEVETAISFYYEHGIFESYAVAEAVREFLISDFELYDMFTHFLAYVAHSIPEFQADPHFRRWYENYAKIQSYITSGSFVRYLVDRYGAEKYMQVHVDVNLFEYVYGVTLDEMILEWMEFLSANAEAFLLGAMAH
ncbi:MAG: hypothetical protein FWC77_06780 [Defluviitaleaceae bacterium]|nr:hypothetical protein [Defluviitaleaceae bacterium]